MDKLLLIILFLFSTGSVAQAVVVVPADTGPDGRPPPEISNMSLPQSIASGVNYYSFIPLTDTTPNLYVHNQSQHDNHILVVGEKNNVTQTTKAILKVDKMGTVVVQSDWLQKFDHIYLISLQPFHTEAEQTMNVMGIPTRHFTTVSPSRQLELVKVEDALGKDFMVGVTIDNTAHYPVYGLKFGFLDKDAQALERDNGTFYDIIEK